MLKKPHYLFPILFLIACSVLISSYESAYAQVPTPRLVADINDLTPDSDADNFVAVGNRVFFTADDGVHGDELWVSDGTEAGTKLVKDITPGPEPGRLLGHLGQGLGSGNILYFTRNTYYEPDREIELWRSDGTETGTFFIKKFTSEMSSLVEFEGQLYFTILKYVDPNWTRYVQLWKSDGTETGTVLVKDLGLSNYGKITELFVNGDKILFLGVQNSDAGGNTAVWTSNGTEAGTQPLQFINEGEFGYLFWPPQQSESGDLFFGGYHRTSDESLEGSFWRTDGTVAGTKMIQTIGIPDGYQWRRAYVIGEDIYYAFVDDFDSPRNGQIWHSSGTSATTTKIADACLGAIKTVGSTILMTAASNCTNFGVWKTDGSAEETVLLREFTEVTHRFTWYYNTITEFKGHGYFTANDGDGFELWRSDGTADGTTVVRDINKRLYDDWIPGPENLTSVGDRLFFSAFDVEVGDELWTTDGTAAGTQLTKDIRTDGTASGNIESLTVLNDKICFTGETERHGSQLWCTDGTESGTVSVQGLCQGTAQRIAVSLTPFSGKLYAAGGAGPDCRRTAVISDGTETGTAYVPEASMDRGFYPTDSHLYYNSNSVHSPNRELWRFDRGSSIPVQIETEAAHIKKWAAIDNVLYYTVYKDHPSSDSSTRIWRSDGTSAGTYVIHEAESNITLFTEFQGNLFFGGASKIWKSDGSTTSPILVKDLNPYSFYLDSYTSTQNSVIQSVATETAFYFIVGDSSPDMGSHGDESLYYLWSSDGASSGTVEVAELGNLNWIRNMVSTPELVYIYAYRPLANGSSVPDLWVHDGTTESTQKITGSNLPTGIGKPFSFYSANEHLYFYSAMTNTETDDDIIVLLRTDGTDSGTEMIVEFPQESYAQTGDDERFDHSVVLHSKEDSGADTDRLYFTANLENKGIELWAIDLFDVGPIIQRVYLPAFTK